jgi:hypothetical protein
LCAANDNILYGTQTCSTNVANEYDTGSYSTTTLYSVDTTRGTTKAVAKLPSIFGIGYKLGCDPNTLYLYALPNYSNTSLPILLSRDGGITWINSGSSGLGSYTFLSEGPAFGDGALFYVSCNCVYRSAINSDGTLKNVTRIVSNTAANTVGIAYKQNSKPTLYLTVGSDESNSIKTLTRQF